MEYLESDLKKMMKGKDKAVVRVYSFRLTAFILNKKYPPVCRKAVNAKW